MISILNGVQGANAKFLFSNQDVIFVKRSNGGILFFTLIYSLIKHSFVSI